jgi:hypothetical protein
MGIGLAFPSIRNRAVRLPSFLPLLFPLMLLAVPAFGAV